MSAVPSPPTDEATPDVLDPGGWEAADVTAFGSIRLAELAAEAGMSFPASVLGAAVAALRSGKHLILTGPPGTGKTTLAELLAEMARGALMCSGWLTTTATSSWTVEHTVGGNYEGEAGTAFRAGVVVDAIETGRWLIVDELNRADVDRAFGELFTMLSGQSVVLPFKRTSFSDPLALVPAGADTPGATEAIHVPKSWRIIATMNDYDRGMLFDLSHALMRRFAFVHVESPDEEVFRSLVAGPGESVARLLPLRDLLDLGPALFVDASEFVAMRRLEGATPSLALFEAFTAFFVPQLDALSDVQVEQVISAIEDSFDPAERESLPGVLERHLLRAPGSESGA
jgi:DNA polymerase III delta prime subunit